MKLLQAAPEDFSWLAKRTNAKVSREARAMKVVDEAGHIRGMVLFDDFWPNSCEAHMAVETPIAWRRLIPACFLFPFEARKVGVVRAEISSANPRSLRMARALGFREVTRIRQGYSVQEDIVVHELRPEDCQQWLPSAQGKV